MIIVVVCGLCLMIACLLGLFTLLVCGACYLACCVVFACLFRFLLWWFSC